MARTTSDESPIPLGSKAVTDLSELLYVVAEQPEESLETQPFRFLDLPQELRFFIYEELMDNKKNDLKYTQPRGFEVESVYIDNLHYPSLLRVCKVMKEEYWSLCLRKATMWITYSRPEYLSSDEEDNEDEDAGENLVGGVEEDADTETYSSADEGPGRNEDANYDPGEDPDAHQGSDAHEDPGPDTANTDPDANADSDSGKDIHKELPLLSTWLKMPKEALAKVVDVVLKFEVKWDLPTASPFSGIAQCTLEMPRLKSILIWSDLESWIVESACKREHRDLHFRWFVEGLCEEESLCLQVQKEYNRQFDVRVGCDIFAPLYEMNKRYRWPRRRHLTQGVTPVAGLPNWGYAMLRVVPLWNRPDEDAFEYHGEEVTFERIEYDLPVPERSEYWEGCSEDEYDWNDDSDWAIGRANGT